MVTTTGAASQISVRNDPQELLMGMLPEGNIRASAGHRLACSSFEEEMPNAVRTTQKPVVLMVAPERRLNRSESAPLGAAGGLHQPPLQLVKSLKLDEP